MDKLELMKTANEIRKGVITAVHSAKSGHPGGSLSAADIYTYLYFEEMNIDPKDPKKQTETGLYCPKDTQLRDIILRWPTEAFSRWRILRPFVRRAPICRDIRT